MAGHTFFGKRRLCYTDVVDFTDFQGIGRDPLYLRYDSVFSVIKTAIAPEYQHFLAVPQYVDDEDHINWHIDDWNDSPVKLTSLEGLEKAKYEEIKENTITHYRQAALKLNGEELQILACAIKYIDDDRIYCADDKVYLVAWGMTPDTKQHKVIGSVIHEYDFIRKFKITFDPGVHGTFATSLDRYITKNEGKQLAKEDIPEIDTEAGWRFVGWDSNPVGTEVHSNITFTAQYSKEEKVEIPKIIPPIIDNEPDFEQFYNCRFDAGDNGYIEGSDYVTKPVNSTLSTDEVPEVKAKKGYKFTGWNISPYNCLIDGNKTFVAQYEKILPWYKRWWLWLLGLFTGKGCLRYLLWLLLFLLGLWLLSFFLRSCVGCTGHHPINGVVPVDSITSSDGRTIDDNGIAHPITGEDGRLPDGDMAVSPVMGDGGVLPPIVKQPGVPDIIGNRLFLFMENENDDVEALAKDFKKAYPGEQYGIIGFDKEVKLLVIQIPEEERDQIRNTINSKIPNHKFIVFDEEIYELNGYVSQSTEDAGWHLNAIHLKQGWNYTKGSSNVKIAVIDDGIQSNHPMFKGRIVDAYNVFTQNNSLSMGEGHGTHTAGLAAGSAEFYSKGASGVAPKCMLMPVQVFDNKMCPLSALVAGVMYALHHDADVVNISIGPMFKGLNVLPVEEQDKIANTQFRNVAALWARVCKLAAKKRSILVFAAGNDDILTSIPPENRNESSIVVTAVDKRMYPTVFTNYGPCSDISAPGKGIYSSFPTSSFQSCDGTSMAAPIVAGAVALMKSIKKDLTVEQARNALYSTGADVYGWIPPMVLIDKALDATKKGNFKRVEREGRNIPDNVNVHLHSGKIPVNSGGVDIPGNPPPAQATPSPSEETDYEAIKRQIAEYQKKIEELKQLLPKK